MLRRLIVVALCACSRPAPRPSPRVAPPAPSTLRFDIGALDRSVDPCSDFYQFACGTWRATHPIPADARRWSRYSELEAENLLRERAIVEDAGRVDASSSPAAQRIRAYYAACMDVAAIEKRGLAPLRPLLSRIDAIRTPAQASAVIAELHAHGIAAVFQAYTDTDLRDAHRQILTLDRGDLGLPDPSAYTASDPEAVALRGRYAKHLARLFDLVGVSQDAAAEQAKRVIAFETNLASRALSAETARHVAEQDHPLTDAELHARVPAIDWPAYFAAIGATPPERVNVAQPAWLDAVQGALAAPDLSALRDTLRASLIAALAHELPASIESEQFAFAQRELRGVREQPPRWKRCLRELDRDLGDDVGREFLARYFPDATRARVQAMIDALLAAFRADIGAAIWLDEPARAAAIAKLDRMLIVLGGSRRPVDHAGIAIARDDAFGNAWRAQAFATEHAFGLLGKPTDRETFFDQLPQALDGFGVKSMNATGFTAGFLQPPVFDPTMDDAINFGGLGAVIGHELSHHLDDEGRKYDELGNARPWWSAGDVERFEQRARCFADEYDQFHLDDGTRLSGRLTLGENVADNGGLRLAYAAYGALHPFATQPSADGFTAAQRFFLAWGQIRCENVTPETARLQAKTNQHAAGRWRVNGVVSNMPEFAAAFACRTGTAMAPEHRCQLW